MLEPLNIAHVAEQVHWLVLVKHFEFFSRLDVLMEFCLSGGVLAVLEVDHIQDIVPGALVAVNTLGLTVALTTIDSWQTLWLDGFKQALWFGLACYENFCSGLLAELW